MSHRHDDDDEQSDDDDGAFICSRVDNASSLSFAKYASSTAAPQHLRINRASSDGKIRPLDESA